MAAVADLTAGAVLTAADLATVRLPADTAPAGATADVQVLIDRVLAAPVRAGEVVTDVRLVGPGLWSQVPEGQVAAPVRLADLAVATLLRAGDRVDVLAATGGSPDAGTDADRDAVPAVEVVAEGALVLTAPPAPGTTPGAGAGPDTGDGLLVLAVPPETAQRLAAAGAAGTLTVTLGRP